MSTSSGSLFLFFSHNSTDIIAITAIMRINNDTVTPKIIFLYIMLLFLPSSCTPLHISPDTSEGSQDKEGVGFRGAGGEGNVVVLLGFRGAGGEGVTEGAVVVEETTTSDGGGGILGDDTGVGASVDVNIVVAALVDTTTCTYD